MDAAGGGCSASFALWEEMDSVDDVVEDESSSVTLGISTGASLEAASTRARRLEAAEASLGVTARAFGGELVMMLMMLMSWCGEGYLLPWSRETSHSRIQLPAFLVFALIKETSAAIRPADQRRCHQPGGGGLWFLCKPLLRDRDSQCAKALFVASANVFC